MAAAAEERPRLLRIDDGEAQVHQAAVAGHGDPGDPEAVAGLQRLGGDGPASAAGGAGGSPAGSGRPAAAEGEAGGPARREALSA